MKIDYCKNPNGNFGDDLNAWLWPKLIPELLEKDDNNYLIGIGTILSKNNIPAHGKKIVFGSGTGYKSDAKIDNTWDIIGVRGGKTVKKYRLSNDKILCDGAYLVRKVVRLDDFARGGRTGFMPHWKSLDLFDWDTECRRLGLHYISPQMSVDDVLNNMKQCNKIIAEAMHGAIVADALRIPWCAVSFGPSFLKFKWDDWASVLNLKLEIHQLPFVVNANVPKKLIRVWKVKQFLGSFGLGKEKWRKFPKINTHKDRLLDKIQLLAASDKFQLSGDEILISLDRKLDIALQYLKENY